MIWTCIVEWSWMWSGGETKPSVMLVPCWCQLLSSLGAPLLALRLFSSGNKKRIKIYLKLLLSWIRISFTNSSMHHQVTEIRKKEFNSFHALPGPIDTVNTRFDSSMMILQLQLNRKCRFHQNCSFRYHYILKVIVNWIFVKSAHFFLSYTIVFIFK